MKLFVYGKLEYPHERGTACAYGTLRIRPGGDAAAQFASASQVTGGLFLGYVPDVVYGQVHDITHPELDSLDKLEAPEYRRRVIELCDGEYAYAYECVCEDFDTWPVVWDGRYRGPHEG